MAASEGVGARIDLIYTEAERAVTRMTTELFAFCNGPASLRALDLLGVREIEVPE